MALLLFLALIVLCSIDVVSTVYGLKSNKATELNPTIRWVMDKVGVLPALIGTKLVFLALTWFFFWNIIILIVLNIIYVGVCVNNTRVLLRIRSENGN
jgi:hypothetical protein